MDISNDHELSLDYVLKRELEYIKTRRIQTGLMDKNDNQPVRNLFGIALSGGGIRSATISMGFLHILNQCGILSKADYLSTVSGGGYAGSYIQARLHEKELEKSSDPYEHLFSVEDIAHLKNHGNYLVPGKGVGYVLGYLHLVSAYVFGLMLSLSWLATLVVALAFLMGMVSYGVSNFLQLPDLQGNMVSNMALGDLVAASVLSLLFAHLLAARLTGNAANKIMWMINFVEGALILFIMAYFLWDLGYPLSQSSIIQGITLFPLQAVGWLAHLLNDAHIAGSGIVVSVDTYIEITRNRTSGFAHIYYVASWGVIFYLNGIMLNPNRIGMYAFYRDRLAGAYLKSGQDLKLSALGWVRKNGEWSKAPYPLINTTLNLIGKSDANFEGTKTCDYFLLSPRFCGSNLTGYLPANTTGYRQLSLADGMAISGAAINPIMGYKTSRFLSLIMMLFNLRLGYLADNPLKSRNLCRAKWMIWWPYYHLQELFLKSNTNRCKVNLSDGGHIENLGVYELLRRKCELIIAVDAGQDENFCFSDLRNLIIRARNELGVKIDFSYDADSPTGVRATRRSCKQDSAVMKVTHASSEDGNYIKPNPFEGFSRKNHAIAKISSIDGRDKYEGFMIYVKSALRAPRRWKRIPSASYLYKTYHPQFPHESTGDQFFDEAQWESYYTIGREMALSLLELESDEESELAKFKAENLFIKNLVNQFRGEKKQAEKVVNKNDEKEVTA